MDDREKLKAEIREEILAEIERKSNKAVPGLENIREKWFNGEDKYHKYDNSKMQQLFGNNQHHVWDAARTLTRVILRKDYCAQLRSLDQNEVEEVMNKICETVYSLGVEVLKKEGV